MLNCSSHTTTFTKGTPNEQWRNTFISSVQLDSRPNSDLQRLNDQIRLPHKFAPIARQSQSGSALCTVIGPSSRTGTANTRSHSSLGNDLTTDPSRSTALRETAPMDCGRTSLLHMRLPFQIWAGAPYIYASGDRSASSLDKAVITCAGDGVGYTPIEMQISTLAIHARVTQSASTSSAGTQAGYGTGVLGAARSASAIPTGITAASSRLGRSLFFRSFIDAILFDFYQISIFGQKKRRPRPAAPALFASRHNLHHIRQLTDPTLRLTKRLPIRRATTADLGFSQVCFFLLEIVVQRLDMQHARIRCHASRDFLQRVIRNSGFPRYRSPGNRAFGELSQHKFKDWCVHSPIIGLKRPSVKGRKCPD